MCVQRAGNGKRGGGSEIVGVFIDKENSWRLVELRQKSLYNWREMVRGNAPMQEVIIHGCRPDR